MTFQPSAPHKRQRWLSLVVAVMTLTVVGASLAFAHGATSIPANYAGGVQVDIHGANDVPGQVDVTQMGRDSSANPNVRIFWAWDSISAWTGSGQTGDACALFDTDDADAFINYVVCARVQNINADPNNVAILVASANHPVYLFDCSNKKNDRCTNPAPRTYTAGQVTAGPLSTLSQSGAGNVISETDPFNASAVNGPGESYPHDSTIDILIASSLVPTGVRLANVCSYPSAGNGGNNNPFDCIVTPGVQFGTLRVVKNLVNNNGGTKTNADFSFQVDGGTATAFEADGSNDVVLPVGTYSVTEANLPITGYTTSYANSLNANANCTSLAVTANTVTTCTITNDDQAGTLIVKKVVVNNNGGTKTNADFSFSVNGGSATAFEADGQNNLTVNAGTYNVTEPAVTGYTTTYDNCSNVVVANGGSATCTITNDDQAGTLIVKKVVINNNGGTKEADDFSFQVDGGTAAAFEADGQNNIAVSAGTYNVTEPAVSGYTTSYDNCSNVVVTNGGSATCTITNDDNIASPSISTTMKWTLNDASTLTGFVTGGGASTVTFTLYKDTATETSCEASTQVFTETVNVNDANGTAATTTGYTTTADGTYRWIASFSGNSFNAAIASDCNSEVTSLP